MESVVAPLFKVRPLDWQTPDPAVFDALLLTSANAARHAGSQLATLAKLPCYCVGETTADAARAAGIGAIRTGPGDGKALLDIIAAEGARRIVHLSGRDHVGLADPRLQITRLAVYATEAVERMPANAARALDEGALALLHSPRAARVFAGLVDAAGLHRARIAIAAISEAAERAAGDGWACSEAAAAPRDQALLELAGKLCKKAPEGGTGMAR